LLAIGLGHPRFLHTDLNLVLQITILAILFVSLFYKRKTKFKAHGVTMGLGVILQILAFILVMGPTFFNNLDFFYSEASVPAVQTTWIHAVPGAIALLLGIFLVARWAVKTSNVTGCYKLKRIMDVTIVLWILSLVFGIATYVLFYL
jgi:hypothetical protein